MRFFILTLCVLFPLSNAAACEGFNNALGALEHAVKQTAVKSEFRTTGKQTPPIAAINRAIDELEAAIEKDRAAKKAQKPAQPRL